jgi:hypothetical protein
MTTAVQVNLPEELISQAQQFVSEGWADNLDAVLADSLRRYLQTHGSVLAEAFIREDLAWGLDGNE